MNRFQFVMINFICFVLFTGISIAHAKPPKPLLWRVSDADNTVYLLGSMHKLKESDYPLDGEVDKAFDDADKIYFEVSPDEMNDPDLAQKMLGLGALAGGESLQRRLAPEIWKSLNAYCASNRIPVENFQRYKPWLVSILISAHEAEKSGLSADSGLDKRLMDRSVIKHKKTAAFETAAEQIAYFDLLSPKAEEQLLYETLKQAEDPAVFDRLHTLWRTADEEGMWKLISEDRKQSPHFFQEFIDGRNDAWLPEITGFLDRNSRNNALVVVGSAHLLGDHGLVKLLAKKGYAVARLP